MDERDNEAEWRCYAEPYWSENAIGPWPHVTRWVLDFGASPLFRCAWVVAGPGGAEYGVSPVLPLEDIGHIHVAGHPAWGLDDESSLVGQRLVGRLMPRAAWYFNHALTHLMEFVVGRAEGRVAASDLRLPTETLTYLEKFYHYWHVLVRQEEELSYENALRSWRRSRLLPDGDVPDQALMLRTLDADSAEDVARIGEALLPYYRTNVRTLASLETWAASGDPLEGHRLMYGLAREPRVTAAVREMVEFTVARCRRVGERAGPP